MPTLKGDKTLPKISGLVKDNEKGVLHHKPDRLQNEQTYLLEQSAFIH